MLPATLAHYRILRPLGAGGMGEVFLAEDTRLGRKVALKVLAPALAADPERRDRFEREARAVAALNHPGIVTLHSVEQDEGVLFLTMEFVEGRTLTELIPRRGLPLVDLLRLAIPLVEAIAAAHQRGITHRDLKPANVMVTEDGRVKVLDFGLAKLQVDPLVERETAMTAHFTVEGRILGTVAYMSPEQAQGKSVDARSDIFSLGILLYEMAAGERPFKGDSHASVLSAILRDTPASITDLRDDLPRDFSRILRRCLAKDPEDRYQTAKDVRNDLRLLEQESASAVDAQRLRGSSGAVPSPSMSAPRRRGRGWLVPGVAVLLVAALAALAVWATRRSIPRDAGPFASIAMRRLTNTGDASLAAISPDGRYVVHVVAGALDKPSLWLRQVSTSSNVQVVPPMEGTYGKLAFTPDGEGILYLFYPPNTFGSLFQIPLLGGPARRLIDDLDSVPAYSPDGRQIAFVRDVHSGQYDVIVANADGSGQRRLATRPALDSYAASMTWSPDGTTIATFAGFMPFHRSRVVLLDVATGKERTLGEERFDLPGQLAWMPDGRSLVFDAVERGGGFGASGQLWAISVPDGAIRRITTDVANYSSLALTKDGRALVAVQHDVRGSLWIAEATDLARARAITAESAGRDGSAGLEWTADRQIVYTATTQGSWDLWVTDPNGGAPRQLTSDPGTEATPAVLPDGRTVAFISRAVGADRLHLRAVGLDGTHGRDVIPDAVMPGFLQSVGDSLFVRRFGGRMARNPVNRVPLAGGPAAPILADTSTLPPNFAVRRISSDGRSVLGTTLDPKVPGVTMAVVPMTGGPPIRTFPFASAGPPPLSGGFGWAPGDRAVEALLLRDGAVNLWRFPLDGTPPKQLTAFTSGRILSFAWSRDGRTLAMSRGSVSADVVLITNQP